ncbi:glycosyltransferase family 2 protein [Hymenobacter oligotrophus]|uniref:Glycosyltransferase family 2 protein n=1 Tax=Hymenobacter oligotrophus TaxID=2319843 RepID=A0A3B7R878_9BACT|nr:glycosyltransferase family A protein [Hymenobacter oligotrophus]AYA37189.1 glycosyltransferase family 2 protein [Hymenobacter oligotrophus]
MSPFFSIVVPCYNRADILPKVVQAILRQDYQDFELILVDDGSRDTTLAVMHELAATDPRIRPFGKTNGERGAARNFGARQAGGQYINFFDSDDEMYPNHLRVVKDYLDANGPVELVHTGYEILDEHDRLVQEVCDFRASTNEALIHNNFLACNTVFVRRDVALNNPFVEDRALASAEDWELWLRLASKYRFHSIPAKTFCLREHEGRSLNTIAPDAVKARDELFAQLMRNNPAFRQRYPQHVQYFVANRYTFITLILALAKNRKKETLRYLWKALQADPTVLWRRRFLASVKHLL